MSFGYGFGLPSWNTLAGGFSPASLFTQGEQGAWYDPSDLSTMFNDAAGTTPVAMPGQGAAVPVGLMLDKSQGLVLGSELVTNGTFDANIIGWSVLSTATQTWTSNGIEVSRGGASFVSQSAGQISLVAGKTYVVTCDVTVAPTAGNGSIGVFGADRLTERTLPGSAARNTVGELRTVFTATTTETGFVVAGISGSTTGTVTFDNISVRELPGNHAIAFNNTTARPELRARVNLVEYSEQLDNAYWTKDAFTVANTTATTDPLGGTTADVCTPTAASAVHRIYKTGAAQVTAASCRYTLSVKSNGYTKIGIRESSTTGAGAAFDLSGSGSVIGAFNAGGSTVSDMSISGQGNGWFRIALTISFASATAQSLSIHALSPSYSAGSTIFESWLPNGTDGYYIWGADLRPANIGANVPAYQRIADANTYDTSGFPLYLRFDGIDDGMSMSLAVSTLNLSAFAGVRETGNSSNNNRYFFIGDATGGVNNLGGFINGQTAANSAIGYRWPENEPVVTALGTQTSAVISYQRPSTTLQTARLNGIAATSNTTSTTTFTPEIARIGCIVSSSANILFFPGNIYSLIIAGSAVSAGNISATEQWVAGKTGIQI